MSQATAGSILVSDRVEERYAARLDVAVKGPAFLQRQIAETALDRVDAD